MISRIAAVCAVALAPILFWQSASNAGVPQAASWNGFETSKLAQAQLQIDSEDGAFTRLTAPPAALSLATKGYIMEPMATTGLMILSLDPAMTQDQQRRSALVLKTVELHKRDKLAQALAMEEAIESEDYSYTFARFDDLAAMRLETVGPLVSALQPLLETEEKRARLREALEEQPRWSDKFWQSVPADDRQFGGYLTLRDELEPEFDIETKNRLVAIFVRRGMRAEAFSLVEDSFEQQTIDQFGYVNSPEFPPIGWQLTTGSNASLEVAGGGNYRVFLARSQADALARQLVNLPAGDYILSATAQPSSMLDFLSLRLLCIGETSRQSRTLRAELNQPFSIGADCSDYILEIYGDAWNSPTDVRGELGSLSLEAR